MRNTMKVLHGHDKSGYGNHQDEHSDEEANCPNDFQFIVEMKVLKVVRHVQRCMQVCKLASQRKLAIKVENAFNE